MVVERELPSEQELETVLDRAVAAQKSWKKVSLKERLVIGEAFVKAFKELGPKIGGNLTTQMGRPASQSLVEVNGTLERARRVLDMAPESLADVTNPVSLSWPLTTLATHSLTW